jgi:hypothetical protein
MPWPSSAPKNAASFAEDDKLPMCILDGKDKDKDALIAVSSEADTCSTRFLPK